MSACQPAGSGRVCGKYRISWYGKWFACILIDLDVIDKCFFVGVFEWVCNLDNVCCSFLDNAMSIVVLIRTTIVCSVTHSHTHTLSLEPKHTETCYLYNRSFSTEYTWPIFRRFIVQPLGSIWVLCVCHIHEISGSGPGFRCWVVLGRTQHRLSFGICSYLRSAINAQFAI